VPLAKRLGVSLRQSYARVGKLRGRHKISASATAVVFIVSNHALEVGRPYAGISEPLPIC
jgi:hypothetical protein